MRKTPMNPGSMVKWSVSIKGVICSDRGINRHGFTDCRSYTNRRDSMDSYPGRFITPN